MKNENIWIYYKIAFGSFQHGLDYFIREILPLAAKNVNSEKWFFIRYYDELDGLHIRFRALVNSGTLDDSVKKIEAMFRPLLLRLNSLPASSYQEMLALNDFSYTPKPIGIRLEKYDPEYEKFGGEIGIGDAEDWFCSSSEIAAEILAQENLAEISRKTLAPALMSIVVDVLVPDPRAFLENYSYSWLTPDIVQRQSLRDEFFEKADQLYRKNIPILQPVNELCGFTRGVTHRWRNAVQKASKKYSEYTHTDKFFGLRQAWQMIHLMNNRLGFSPLEEAYLATLLEAHYAMVQSHAA